MDPAGPVTLAASVAELLDALAETMPDANAVVDDHETLTYGELHERVADLARRIEARTRPQEPVGVLVSPGIDAVVAFHAILRSNRVAVMLDERAPRAVTSEFMEHAGARVAVTDDGPTVGVRSASTLDGAAVYYTSGSTGAPKAFVVSDQAMLDLARSCAEGYGMRPGERAALVFHHSFGAARVSLLGSLAAGAALRVYDAQRLAPNELADAIERDRVGFVHCSPTLLRSALSSLEPGPNLRDLRLLATGADALTAVDVEQFRARTDPGCVLAHTYATSETGPIAAFFVDVDAPIGNARIPVGRCLPGKQVLVEDADDRGVGEILVGGVGLASGYVANPAESNARFVRDASGVGWFRTNDRGRLHHDGVLEHHGRSDNVLKVRGYTVDLDEVERALRAVRHVEDAAAHYEPQPRPRLVAYLVCDDTPAPTIGAIREQLRERLATQLVPAAYVFVDRLPRDGRGKLARADLPPVPATRPSLSVPFAAPSGELELAVAHAFETALGVAPVGVDDDFFELGGDSLAALEVTEHLRETLGRELTTAAFLDASTVGALASLLSDRSDSELLSTIVTIKPVGTRPPFVCVHGGGGGVLDFGELAAALHEDRPFLAIQPGRVPLSRLATVRRLAAYYVNCLRSAGVEQLSALAGFSFGASVAFEMARSLARAGHVPPLVVLIDPRRAHASPPRRAELRQRASWTKQRFRFESQGKRHAHLVHPDAVYKLSLRAVRYHRLLPYAGDALLVTTDPDASRCEEWESVVRGRLDVVTMEGDHNAVMRTPLVTELARHVEEALARREPGARS